MNVRQIDNGPLLAQLNEQKVSNNTTCELQGNTTPNMSQVVSVIEVAQRLYPDYFPASARPNHAFEIVSGAFSRRYRQTGMEITISNNQVYLTGKEYGFVPVNVGSLTAVAQILAAESAKRAGTVNTPANPSTPSNPSTPAPTDPIKPGDAIPPGDSTLKISGTVSASVFGTTTSTPLNISINSIPAPGKTDLDGLADEVRKALANAEGVNAATFTSFNFSEVSISNNRVFFRAQCAATTSMSGLTVQQSYNLTYAYLRK